MSQGHTHPEHTRPVDGTTPGDGGNSVEGAEILEEKHAHLLDALATHAELVVAFSGGVDSSLLLAAAVGVLGSRVVAVTGVSASLSEIQRDQAERVVAFLGARHVRLTTEELSSADYAANPPDRCFFCKDELYRRLRQWIGGRTVAIADGSNADDLKDVRPGMTAARAHGVISPLLDAGLTKAEIRTLSRHYRLETADMPSSPCLSSRLPYGNPVTVEALARIEAAEASLRAAGFREFRVRHLGRKARVEIAAAEINRTRNAETVELIVTGVRRSGFEEVEIDTRPLRSGRLNDERPT